MAKTKNIINFKQLKKISNESSLINSDGPYLVKKSLHLNQIIRPSTNDELDLYKQSCRFLFFREHVLVRAKTSQGLSFDSKVFKGSFNKFKNIKLLENAMKNLDFQVRRNSLELVSFEIIHTHPTGCYLEEDNGDHILSLGGISKADTDVAAYFHDKFKVLMSIRAICPGNITFCSA
jgi:hypothetical protein